MAKAKKITRTETRVRLTLTEEEADFLITVLAGVGGPISSVRGTQLKISDALETAVGRTHWDIKDLYPFAGEITFYSKP